MPGKREPPTRPKHDASYKNFFTHPRTIADTLRAVAGDLSRHLDFTTLERMPASFVTEHLSQRHTDMLWRIETTQGGWTYILILLEFQSTIDRRMALRMSDYTTTIWMRLGKEDLGPRGEYPFVLPIVIYNGERRWTAPTDIGDLFGPAPGELLGYRPRHRYLLIEIQSEDPASLPPSNVLAMIARCEQAPTAELLEELLGPLWAWLDTIGEPELTGAFRKWIGLAVARRFGEAGRELERKVMEEEKGAMTLLERAREWGKEYDRQWMEKLEKGVARGIARERQASIERERELVHRMVTRKFGPGTSEQLRAILDHISDPDDIAPIADAVIECETAEEFLERVRGD